MLFFDDLTDVLKIEEFWSAENHVYTENESDNYYPKKVNTKITKDGSKKN